MALKRHTFDIVLADDDASVERIEELIREAIGDVVTDIEYIGASDDPGDEDACDQTINCPVHGDGDCDEDTKTGETS